MNNYLKKARELKPILAEEKIELNEQYELLQNESAILDFGEHVVGYPTIRFSFKGHYPDSPVFLKVFFAEYEKELEEDIDSYKGWISKGWIQEEFIHLDRFPCSQHFSRRYAFRYVKITIINAPQNGKTVVDKIIVKKVTSAPESIPLCGDTDIERAIDKVSIKTLSECMQYEFEDGPKRDKRLWFGDLRLQALANYKTFGHNDLVKRCLYLFAGATLADGRICQSVYTGSTVCGDGQTNFDYSLLFVPTLLDYMMETSDFETVKELLPIAVKQIEVARDYFDGDVIVDREIGWCFLDWSMELNRQAGAQAVYIYAEKALVSLLDYFQLDTIEYRDDLKRKSTQAIVNFYDEKRGLVISGESKQVSYASNVWFVLAGLFDEDTGSKILGNLKVCKNIVKPVTPYMMHHYVQALIDCGLTEIAKDTMITYWGGMVKLGADTFWELYNPENPNESPYGGTVVHSYCHAWSCTPCYFLRRYFNKGVGESV